MLPALLAALFACGSPCAEGYGRDADGNCVALATGDGAGEVPSDDTGSSGADDTSPPDDTGDTGAEDTAPVTTLDYGDPIVTHATFGSYSPGNPLVGIDKLIHTMDAEILSEDYALVVGEGGTVVVRMSDASAVAEVDDVILGYRTSYDPSTERAWVATRYDWRVIAIDVSDPTTPVSDGEVRIEESWHEDLAADGGRLLVAAQDSGGLLYDVSGGSEAAVLLATIDADNAVGAALDGDRALLADGAELILLDLADPSAPAELDRIALPGHGRDIHLDGDRVAVAMASDGAAVYEIVDGALAEIGAVETPGACFSVALDGDYLWMAAWEQVVLAWLGGGSPVVVGHEPVTEWAIGVGAIEGRVMVADWFWTTVMERVEGVGGPEIDVPPAAWVTADATSASVTVKNAGYSELSVEIGALEGEATAEPGALSLSPGESAAILVSLPGGGQDLSIPWTSDDPDEPEGAIALQLASQSLGTEHVDFDLLGFTPPSGALQPFALSDYRGKVVVLVYFSVT